MHSLKSEFGCCFYITTCLYSMLGRAELGYLDKQLQGMVEHWMHVNFLSSSESDKATSGAVRMLAGDHCRWGRAPNRKKAGI
jgi:hypothetical protein